MLGGIFSIWHASPAMLLTRISYFEYAVDQISDQLVRPWHRALEQWDKGLDSCKTAQESMVPKRRYLG